MRFSQVDAAYPLSGKDGPIRGVPYVMHAIQWAAQTGCPRVDTTDGLHAPPGLSDEEAMELMKRSYEQILEIAEAHQIDRQHRAARLLHHQARVHGPDAAISSTAPTCA